MSTGGWGAEEPEVPPAEQQQQWPCRVQLPPPSAPPPDFHTKSSITSCKHPGSPGSPLPPPSTPHYQRAVFFLVLSHFLIVVAVHVNTAVLHSHTDALRTCTGGGGHRGASRGPGVVSLLWLATWMSDVTASPGKLFNVHVFLLPTFILNDTESRF